jgi:hypothetical protein
MKATAAASTAPAPVIAIAVIREHRCDVPIGEKEGKDGGRERRERGADRTRFPRDFRISVGFCHDGGDCLYSRSRFEARD